MGNKGPTFLLAALLLLAPAQAMPSPADGKVVVGYWHNWQNASAPFIRLKDVSGFYNVICVAFGESGSLTDMTMKFAPDPALQSEADFIADVKVLQAKGKKVLLSLGGQNGWVELSSPEEKEKFIQSMDALIKRYGFNGLDIDLEGGCVHLGAGDGDFRKPASLPLVNLIDAIRTLRTRNGGADFWITAAPEVAYVQGGISAYTGIWGAYLPVLHGLRDVLAYVHVQYYNTGGNDALDGKLYNQGTADFIVAMTEMLLAGFPVAGSAGNIFPGFQESQVAIGLPAVTAAAGGGFLPFPEVIKALDCLTKGKTYGGGYTLRKAGGYPGLRGIMTWSINWDATHANRFGETFSAYFSLPAASSLAERGMDLRPAGREWASPAIISANGAYLGTLAVPAGGPPRKKIPRGSFLIPGKP